MTYYCGLGHFFDRAFLRESSIVASHQLASLHIAYRPLIPLRSAPSIRAPCIFERLNFALTNLALRMSESSRAAFMRFARLNEAPRKSAPDRSAPSRSAPSNIARRRSAPDRSTPRRSARTWDVYDQSLASSSLLSFTPTASRDDRYLHQSVWHIGFCPCLADMSREATCPSPIPPRSFYSCIARYSIFQFPPRSTCPWR